MEFTVHHAKDEAGRDCWDVYAPNGKRVSGSRREQAAWDLAAHLSVEGLPSWHPAS